MFCVNRLIRHLALRERPTVKCSSTVISVPKTTLMTDGNVTNKISKPLSISSIYKEDLNEAYLLPVLPTTFNKHALWMNVDKYHVYDDEAYVAASRLAPLLPYSTIGSGIPIVTVDSQPQPSERLADHWERSIPEFSRARTIHLRDALEDNVPIITYLPMQALPVHKHSVNPDDHYRVLMKTVIPEMGVRHPRYMEPHDATFPALVKLSQGMGGHGNYRVDNREQLFKVLQKITQLYGKEAARGCIVSELIQRSPETLCCHYYLPKTGKAAWLGVNKNLSDADGKYLKTVSNWDEDEALRERLFNPFVVPVSDYLNDNGYFGWVCVDIVVGEHGGDYLVDVNARLCGSTPHILLANNMARFPDYSKGVLLRKLRLNWRLNDFLDRVEELNTSKRIGRIIITKMVDKGSECESLSLSAFGNTTEGVQELLNNLPELLVQLQ